MKRYFNTLVMIAVVGLSFALGSATAAATDPSCTGAGETITTSASGSISCNCPSGQTQIVALDGTQQCAANTAASTGAADSSSKGQICNGIGLVNGGSNPCTTPTTGQSGVGHLVATIVNLLSWVVGIIAVIMIVLAGLKYITSGGSSEKLGSAKNTLIYALVGIVIVVLAQFLVHFTVTTASNVCSTNSQLPSGGKCKN